MKKIIAILTLIVILISTLSSCGAEYKDNVSVSEIADKIKTNIKEKDELGPVNEMFLQYTLGVDPSLVAESLIMQGSTDTYDEFGVLKAKSKEDASKIKKDIVEQYFPAKDALMKNYNPDQYAKIEKAECKVYGVYVVYFILSESERTASIKDVEEFLKG